MGNNMKASPMSRREFLQTATVAGVAVAASTVSSAADGVQWPVACFNRPWMQAFNTKRQPLSQPQPANWGMDVALRGIKEAGYDVVGLLTRMPDEPVIGPEATEPYLNELKGRIATAKLAATMGALRLDEQAPLEDSISNGRRQIDHARALGLEWLLTFGVNNKAHYDTFYKTMADLADYSEERKIKLVMKPHGGASGASDEILRCIEKVNRPNFNIWYDAGNIIYYTGKDPIEELKPIVRHVTGFCAKDCHGPKEDVMIQFGTGSVDFRGVFNELKKAGFHGPIFVEGCAGKSYEEITAGARANRVFLQTLLGSL
jgi:sugar phosphate isomerase/epimerase